MFRDFFEERFCFISTFLPSVQSKITCFLEPVCSQSPIPKAIEIFWPKKSFGCSTFHCSEMSDRAKATRRKYNKRKRKNDQWNTDTYRPDAVESLKKCVSLCFPNDHFQESHFGAQSWSWFLGYLIMEKTLEDMQMLAVNPLRSTSDIEWYHKNKEIALILWFLSFGNIKEYSNLFPQCHSVKRIHPFVNQRRSMPFTPPLVIDRSEISAAGDFLKVFPQISRISKIDAPFTPPPLFSTSPQTRGG